MNTKIKTIKNYINAADQLWLSISMIVASVYLASSYDNVILKVVAGTLAFKALTFVLVALVSKQEKISRSIDG